MAEMKFTPAQKAAVEYGGGNLLLSAAAGSGKTAALTSRIARLITEDGARLSEMLIVTFTRAAAAEMRERIAKRLSEALNEAKAAGDEQVTARAARAIGELPGARISTIHSFLYQSMKPYFPSLGLSPDARILEEQTAANLRAEVMKDAVDDAFSAPGPESPDEASFPELADIIGHARDADAIDGELLWLHNRITSAGLRAEDLCRFADLQESLAAGDEDPLSSPWGAEIRVRCAEFASHYRRAIAGARERFDFGKEEEKYGPDADRLIEWCARTEDMARDPRAGYDALAGRLRDLVFGTMPTVTKKNLTEAGETYKLFRGDMKKRLESLIKGCVGGSAEEIREGAAMTSRILRCAARVLTQFREKLNERKREMAALDYGDLESCAIALLTDGEGNRTKAAEEIGRGLRYLFIDEYQDTNDVQDRIFRAVSPEAHRFMVGDIKQSIYRFRGADPSVFSGYRRVWPTVTPEECAAEEPLPVLEGEAGRSLFMSENFRCAEAVVEFSNAVSAHLLPWGGIPFEEEDLLIHARVDDPADAPDAEVVVIEVPRQKGGGDPESEEDGAGDASSGEDPGERLDPEAEYVADRIAGMVGRYRGDGGTIMKAGDAAILMRSGKNAEVYRAALERRGIPAVMKTARALGSYPSVMLLTCLLNMVDNPLRDIYTAGALRSPVFSVDVAGLIAIREAAGDMPLYTGVEKLAGDPESALSEKCRQVREWLHRQRTVARGMASDSYTEFLLRDTDFFALDGIRENGAERDAIYRFTAAVRSRERVSGGGGLSGLTEELPDMLKAMEDTGTVRRDDAVSIMTIHASKGLEFPVCFLCECAKKRNTEDEQRSVLFDPALGFGMTLPDPGGLARCDTFLRQAIGSKIAREAVNEEMRMLYVAMTRARDQLIVTGRTTNADKLFSESAIQAQAADAYRAEAAGSYLRWILEALEAHPAEHVRVTVHRAAGAEEEQSASDGVSGPAEAEEASASDDPGMQAVSGEEGALTEEEADRLAEMLRERFAFRYRNVLGRIPSKLTVSRLHPEILDEDGGGLTVSLDESAEGISDSVRTASEPVGPVMAEEIPLEDGAPEDGEREENPHQTTRAPRRPAFMTGGPQTTGADRGSATHVFLQFVQYRNLRDNGVEAETERLVREKFLSREAAGLIYRWQLERFRESALMDALLRSPMVKREFRFNALLPAERFTRDPDYAALLRDNGATVTVQGVVDCVYRDPDGGGLVLVDYKTDALGAEERRNPALAAEKLLNRHRNQLSYYREICAAMFEEPVARTVIYSTVLGRCVEVE